MVDYLLPWGITWLILTISFSWQAQAIFLRPTK
jgi:hypothetical protein